MLHNYFYFSSYIPSYSLQMKYYNIAIYIKLKRSCVYQIYNCGKEQIRNIVHLTLRWLFLKENVIHNKQEYISDISYMKEALQSNYLERKYFF